MSVNSVFEQNVLKFRDEYLRNQRRVSIFRKLRKYSRFGMYATGLLAYVFISMFLTNQFARYSIPVIGAGIITIITGVLTALFQLNKRKKYDFDDIDLGYHEVAAFIDDVENAQGNDQLSESIARFDNFVIQDDEGVLPKTWRDELREFFDYIHESDDNVSDSINTVFSRLVEDMERLSEVDLSDHYTEERETTRSEEEPGFVGVLLDTVTSDIISRQVLIWITFILAASGGLVLAFFQGQGWGVLLVTIVFAGLRLYDQRGE